MHIYLSLSSSADLFSFRFTSVYFHDFFFFLFSTLWTLVRLVCLEVTSIYRRAASENWNKSLQHSAAGRAQSNWDRGERAKNDDNVWNEVLISLSPVVRFERQTEMGKRRKIPQINQNFPVEISYENVQHSWACTLVLTKHGMSIETYAGGPSYGTEIRYDMSVDGRKLLCGSYLK